MAKERENIIHNVRPNATSNRPDVLVPTKSKKVDLTSKQQDLEPKVDDLETEMAQIATKINEAEEAKKQKAKANKKP